MGEVDAERCHALAGQCAGFVVAGSAHERGTAPQVGDQAGGGGRLTTTLAEPREGGDLGVLCRVVFHLEDLLDTGAAYAQHIQPGHLVLTAPG